ncbi:MAG: DUF1295 domain-containing protein [Rikenellaceae bacterium]
MDRYYTIFLVLMSITALAVFVALYFVTAGYGKFASQKWGPAINNKLGWVLMESPVFIVMCMLWVFSERRFEPALLVMFLIFQSHYIQRSFIFPFLIKGTSKMPLSIILMGITFNILNAIMQGGWLFYISASDRYPLSWLYTPQFIIGTILFFVGMSINIKSDSIVRNLRKPGDTNHYLPRGGMYNYVTSANYFGEIVEWVGFAVLTWSYSGLVFAWWTFANLVPRAAMIYNRYKKEFTKQMEGKRLKRIIPRIY